MNTDSATGCAVFERAHGFDSQKGWPTLSALVGVLHQQSQIFFGPAFIKAQVIEGCRLFKKLFLRDKSLSELAGLLVKNTNKVNYA